MQRRKGAVAEREIAGILRSRGHDARRTGQAQSQNEAPDADVTCSLEGHHIESKRQERIEIEKWCKQAEDDAADGDVPVVVWRRSRQPWRVTLALDAYLDLYEKANPT